jgi:DNA-binding transcriptional LysR family regulator
MSDRLQELSAFIRAAETGSFSKVARELGTSQPSVSRMVASLENRLGVKLLLRTTRRVTVTEAGGIYLERARQVLRDLDEAESAARGADSLHGTLRVGMSSAFATREVIPHLPAFLSQHPRLKIELLISDQRDDLVAAGVDIALRLGALSDSGFGSRLLAKAPRLCLAAPAYLARRGTPQGATELANHDCIIGPGVSGVSGWTFRRDGAVTSLTLQGRVRVTTAEGAIACAKAGLGIVVASHWMCKSEVQGGELVVILAEYQLDPVEVHALYPAGRRPSPKVRAFSDYLAARLNRASDSVVP